MNIKVARIFNTYGPNMQKNDGRVVSNFIVQALEGENITIYGDGKQTRSFCYVSDQVDGLIKLMNSDVNVTGPINIGNPCELTVSEIANFIVSMTESTSQIVYQDLPADDPQKRKPDISLAKEILGWKPVVELTNGLNQTIDYFSKIINCG